MRAQPYRKSRRLGNAHRVGALACLAALLCAPLAIQAGGLGVSPTLIDLHTGASVAAVKVQNLDTAQPVSVQVRVVRWQQGEVNQEVYSPTDAVVASPPMTLVMPGAENLIRIVRTEQSAPQGEESYRLLIDQLPAPGTQQAGTVQMLVRHAVPVFFAHPQATPARVDWQIERVPPGKVDGVVQPPGWRLIAHNQGDKRLRLADVVLTDAAGHTVAQRAGLVGYVLGRTRGVFFVPEAQTNTKASPQALRLSLQSETGTLNTEWLPVAAPATD